MCLKGLHIANLKSNKILKFELLGSRPLINKVSYNFFWVNEAKTFDIFTCATISQVYPSSSMLITFSP
jgi:hypothetical protein